MPKKTDSKKKNNIVIVTHPGSFHADDVCAVATLLLYIEKKFGMAEMKRIKIVRTSDPKIIEKADFVVDVGLLHDEKKNRFDHHQKGRAGMRLNGVEYASFGLVWKKFGKYLCGSQEVADIVDRIMVQDVDAADNGFDFFKTNIKGTAVFRITDMITFERASVVREGDFVKNIYKSFIYMVGVMRRTILSVISEQVRMMKGIDLAKKIYTKTTDKSVLVLPRDIFVIQKDVPETLFTVYKSDRGTWAARVVKKDYDTFETDFKFPEEWAGKPVQDLQQMTGIDDIVFAHPGRFYVATKTKESAVKVAKLAVSLAKAQ